MTEFTGGKIPDQDAAILTRAKALATADGFTWEFDFDAPPAPHAKLRHRHFLSKDRQQDYLERAKLALSEMGRTDR